MQGKMGTYINLFKEGIQKISDHVEHASSLWSTIQEANDWKENLLMISLDLANGYVTLTHSLIEKTMEKFWFPEELKSMLMHWYNTFRMRFLHGMVKIRSWYCANW